MTDGHKPTDRIKLGSKRYILTDKYGTPLFTLITSANTYDITVATNTIDNCYQNTTTIQIQT